MLNFLAGQGFSR